MAPSPPAPARPRPTASHGDAGLASGMGGAGRSGKKIAVRKRRGIIVFSPVPFNGSVREINGNGMEGI